MNLRIGVVCGLAMMLLPGIGSRSPTAAAAEAKAEFVPAERQRVIVLTDTSVSPHVKLRSVNIDAVRWTDGFWAERFDWCRKVVIPNMWRLLADPNISHAYENFLIAAGQKQGRHRGPKWNDGDFYRWLEAVAFVYATTRDEALDRQMDAIIETIGKAQRDDGYLYTPAIIAQRQHLPEADEFRERLGEHERKRVRQAPGGRQVLVGRAVVVLPRFVVAGRVPQIIVPDHAGRLPLSAIL